MISKKLYETVKLPKIYTNKSVNIHYTSNTSNKNIETNKINEISNPSEENNFLPAPIDVSYNNRCVNLKYYMKSEGQQTSYQSNTNTNTNNNTMLSIDKVKLTKNSKEFAKSNQKEKSLNYLSSFIKKKNTNKIILNEEIKKNIFNDENKESDRINPNNILNIKYLENANMFKFDKSKEEIKHHYSYNILHIKKYIKQKNNNNDKKGVEKNIFIIKNNEMSKINSKTDDLNKDLIVINNQRKVTKINQKQNTKIDNIKLKKIRIRNKINSERRTNNDSNGNNIKENKQDNNKQKEKTVDRQTNHICKGTIKSENSYYSEGNSFYRNRSSLNRSVHNFLDNSLNNKITNKGKNNSILYMNDQIRAKKKLYSSMKNYLQYRQIRK